MIVKRIGLLIIIFVTFVFSSCKHSPDVLGVADFGGAETVMLFYNSGNNTLYGVLVPVSLGVSSSDSIRELTGRKLDFYASGDLDDYNKMKIILSAVLNKQESIKAEDVVSDFLSALVTKNAYFTNSEIASKTADVIHADISSLVNAASHPDVTVNIINSGNFLAEMDSLYAYDYFKIWLSQITGRRK